MPDSVRIIVSGLVQGVGFRYFTYRQASQCNLKGYARNLATGQVEIVAVGEKGQIDEFVKAVRVGPRYASVSSVEMEKIKLKETFNDFNIR